MTCWYCYWGWPVQVTAIYKKYLQLTDESAMNYGRGHIVWADENFDTESIQHCINSTYDFSHATLPAADELVKKSLLELLEVPEEIRCCEPDNYDGENPQNYPPPSNIEMSRKR